MKPKYTKINPKFNSKNFNSFENLRAKSLFGVSKENIDDIKNNISNPNINKIKMKVQKLLDIKI